MKQLTNLWVYGNGLRIPYNAQPFTGMSSLRHIAMDRNFLETASYCTFGPDSLPVLKVLDLDVNPLVCNCTLAWMLNTVLWPNDMSECKAKLSSDGYCSDYSVPDCGAIGPISDDGDAKWRMWIAISAGIPCAVLVIVGVIIAVWCCRRRQPQLSGRQNGITRQQGQVNHVYPRDSSESAAV